ncbi:hypothetical protein B0T25DRAFT_470421 [Lasiosphaeria hispida]|uniref:Uncharacterized protein n=1 Tax=Lasiosphaeria hispida TaxID=260671 RepID=A0AAJ0HWQ2_9PEZI|nr:hypothetical protein B0T25DRAFT_470421 [Lasiosphaeria hispida]
MDVINAMGGATLAQRTKSESVEAGLNDNAADINDDIDDGNDDIDDGNGDTNEQYLPFRNVRDFFARVNACTEETFFVFSPVSAADYEALLKSRDRRGQKFQMDLWDGTQLWITTHASGLHETLHGHLDDKILLQVASMGLCDDWKRVGTTTFTAGAGGSGGEGDSSRKPVSQRPLPAMWPTLVIEGGYSQSLRKLRHKARWWLQESNFEVKIVLIAKCLRTSKTILVEKWVGIPPLAQISPPNVTTRAQQQRLNMQGQGWGLVPGKAQTVTIRPIPGVDPRQTSTPNSFQVVRSPLVLEFSLLFLRQPGAGEGNVSLGAQAFQSFAASIWQDVE